MIGKLFEVIKDDNLPSKMLEMLESLDIDAQQLLADHYDENSNTASHFQKRKKEFFKIINLERLIFVLRHALCINIYT